ncbi:MAG: hypothetical protein ABSE63_01530 [Thermoguttaceae bacterium]
MESIAKKQFRRDALAAGAEYDVALKISGEVGKASCAFLAEGHVVVNHDGVRLASQSPPIAQLTAYLLGLLPKAKRENVLKTLPEIFAAADNRLPDVDAGLVDAAQKMLDRLRSKIQQHVHGSISVAYRIDER